MGEKTLEQEMESSYRKKEEKGKNDPMSASALREEPFSGARR